MLFVAGFHFLLHRHRFGNHVFATGGNRGAAEAIGINTNRVKLVAFAIAGGMAAVAGILATARVGSVQPGQGAGLELQAIAACVIGGLPLRGGRGSIIGIFLGVAHPHHHRRAAAAARSRLLSRHVHRDADRAGRHLQPSHRAAGCCVMSNLLELHNISKSFGALTALRNLSFHIGEGEVVGLLGDNGAGKSMTVNLISGIHKPTDGYLSVDGKKTLFTCRSDLADAGIETIYQHSPGRQSLDHPQHLHGRERLIVSPSCGRPMREIAMEVLQNAVHISH